MFAFVSVSLSVVGFRSVVPLEGDIMLFLSGVSLIGVGEALTFETSSILDWRRHFLPRLLPSHPFLLLHSSQLFPLVHAQSNISSYHFGGALSGS